MRTIIEKLKYKTIRSIENCEKFKKEFRVQDEDIPIIIKNINLSLPQHVLFSEVCKKQREDEQLLDLIYQDLEFRNNGPLTIYRLTVILSSGYRLFLVHPIKGFWSNEPNKVPYRWWQLTAVEHHINKDTQCTIIDKYEHRGYYTLESLVKQYNQGYWIIGKIQ